MLQNQPNFDKNDNIKNAVIAEFTTVEVTVNWKFLKIIYYCTPWNSFLAGMSDNTRKACTCLNMLDPCSILK